MDGISEILPNSHSVTPPLHPQRLIVAIALFLLTSGAILLSQYGWKQSVLFLIGGLLGVTLYHSSFGFASAYRKLFVQREVRGMYAQLLMLAIATLLFAPVLARGSVWGETVRGAIAPVSMQGAIGAFLFGIGMQLGGACGCGTLYTIGGGSLTMLLTLISFCIGAFGASLTRQFWVGLPATPPIVLGTTIGWIQAIVVQFIAFGLLVIVLRWWRKGGPETAAQPFDPAELHPGLRSLVRGPWPVWAGAISLALLNWLTLLLSGHPWRITWGFALWAAQIAHQLGWNLQSNPFWGSAPTQKILSQGIFADVSSVMNIGIVLGALLAAALSGRLVAKATLTLSLLVSPLSGGLIMGYGAFLAAGCNVSAFFGGIASTSLHGWVWIIFALLGTLIGIRFRPGFDIDAYRKFDLT